MECPSTLSTYRPGENILLNKNGIIIYIMDYKNRIIYSLSRVTAQDEIMEFPLANRTYVIVKLIIYYHYYICDSVVPLHNYISTHKT